jgi:LytS/YehU family sensor histidine kinase
MTAQVVGNKLNLNITDTGSDANFEEAGQRRGIGLSNIQQRLEVAYISDYTFNASFDDSMGFSVNMSIPYQVTANKNSSHDK